MRCAFVITNASLVHWWAPVLACCLVSYTLGRGTIANSIRLRMRARLVVTRFRVAFTATTAPCGSALHGLCLVCA